MQDFMADACPELTKAREYHEHRERCQAKQIHCRSVLSGKPCEKNF